jgi:hypothetical protein
MKVERRSSLVSANLLTFRLFLKSSDEFLSASSSQAKGIVDNRQPRTSGERGKKIDAQGLGRIEVVKVFVEREWKFVNVVRSARRQQVEFLICLGRRDDVFFLQRTIAVGINARASKPKNAAPVPREVIEYRLFGGSFHY